jgi:hypothetical protein
MIVYPKMCSAALLAGTYFAARPMIVPSSTSQSIRSRPFGSTMSSPFPIITPSVGLMNM